MQQPSFKRPPVVETIFGVQFERLPSFSNGHLGLFWKRLGPEWPVAVDAPPLPQEIEQFGPIGAWSLQGLMGLKLSQDLSTRLQIRSASGDRMVQLQNGKLLYNWVGQGGESYPRYKVVKSEFDDVVAAFRQFLGDERMEEWRPNQWEVSYLNRLPRGTVWSTPSDWAELLRLSPQAAAADLGDVGLESVQGQWHYEIRPQRGRLHVGLAHGNEPGPNGQESVALTLTARGPILGGGTFDDGIQLGHDTIVRSFAALTSQAAHEYWEEVI